jgi:two-component system LytT family response regulator
MMLRAVLADDEPPARRKLASLLARQPDIRLEGQASTGTEAVELIQRVKPDVAFLDIQMPGMDGFEVAEALGTLEMQVVFVTAYDKHAAKAFDVEAADYLLKPYSLERLELSLTRLRRACAARNAPQKNRYWTRILVQGPRFATFIAPSEIDWIEADRNYVVLHCGSKEHLVRSTLDAFASRLDPDVFIRISRSAAVRLDCIKKIEPATHGDYRLTLADEKALSLSRRFVSASLGRFIPEKRAP